MPKFCRILEILESVASVDLSLLSKEQELIDEETQLGSDPPEKGKGEKRSSFPGLQRESNSIINRIVF